MTMMTSWLTWLARRLLRSGDRADQKTKLDEGKEPWPVGLGLSFGLQAKHVQRDKVEDVTRCRRGWNVGIGTLVVVQLVCWEAKLAM